MLLLSRKLKETIMIGDDIQIELVFSDKTQAIIGIRAPKDIPVHRQEVYDKCKSILKKSDKNTQFTAMKRITING